MGAIAQSWMQSGRISCRVSSPGIKVPTTWFLRRMKEGLWILLLGLIWPVTVPAIDSAKVIILVNEADHDSIDLGYYYALKREVPLKNIVHLPLPADENIS